MAVDAVNEQAVLGAALVDPEVRVEVVRRLAPDLFLARGHRDTGFPPNRAAEATAPQPIKGAASAPFFYSSFGLRYRFGRPNDTGLSTPGISDAPASLALDMAVI